MRDIKIGEYIRTKYGIAKFIDYEIERLGIIVVNKKIAYDHIDEYKNVITPKEILKHSFNIIDLIEEGDYVNGDKIVKIEEDIYIGGLNLWTERNAPDGFGGFYRVKYREKDIKSIVTKEQLKAVEYEVK